MNMGKRAQNKFNGKRGLLLTVDRNISILVLVCEWVTKLNFWWQVLRPICFGIWLMRLNVLQGAQFNLAVLRF